MDDQTLLRTAGVSAVIAVIAMFASGVTIALFFGGLGEYWGPVNDVFVAATMLALILPILAVGRMSASSGMWLDLVSLAAVAGAVLIAVGQLLLVAGLINLQASFVTGGLGVIPVLLWMLALVVLALGSHTIPAAIGVAASVALGVIVLTILGFMATSGIALWLVCGALFVSLTAWLAALAVGLLRQVAASA